ncbi:MAG: hypothetical protein ACI8XM_002955 [Haloarculaceae archaeon]|jgi:uncharacterized protein (DUF1684 family)
MDWVSQIERDREEKDRYFGGDPRSPLRADQQEHFEGLAYYPIDEGYRYELPLEEYDEPEHVVVGTSTEGQQEYLAVGEFTFEVDGTAVTLRAFKSEPDEDRLWVPFRDATSGESTYGAGRYLDLEPDRHRTEEGRWILDFNEAYNPTCAYSDRYECPLPPTENWLEVSIEAGEKAFEAGH